MTTTKAIRDALVDADFPLEKWQVVEAAEGHGTSHDVIRALRALPLADYENVDEVLRSVPIEDSTTSR